MKKQHLPEKVCEYCQRSYTWRKKWERCWDEVRYCSERCKREAKRERAKASTTH
ncbi:DUF2256 domain-containing protein [uncultured Acinetobacter sp.]|uniref:DUF2256 domain-containing protein n=1 Tax=uncultured Acinetobacter sp. TaxID=165433 RepID=UPI003747C29A